MADNYEPLGPVPAADLPPPPPMAPMPVDPISHAPAQTKFENAFGNNNVEFAAAKTTKTDLRSAPSAPPRSSKKGGSKSKKNNNKKKGSNQNSQKTDEKNNEEGDENEEEEKEKEGSGSKKQKKVKKIGFGNRAKISLFIISIVMAISGVGTILGIVGMVMGWTLDNSAEDE